MKTSVIHRIVLVGAVAIFAESCADNVAPGVSREGLLSVRPGMSRDQLLGLLGKPLAKHGPVGSTSARVDADCPEMETWTYGTPGYFSAGIEIWARFCGNELAMIMAERHDLGFFWCKKEACPVVWQEHEWELLPAKVKS